ncbi:VOC family protein [Microterricola viridarii]|uniref:Glyoxalase n=1 Tax=Microterricola viridarii TaxID=412690 RepID=A0A0X8E231_9MICO|nr:VOC family protein [Microterricola viridarii]AMB58981.1 glyoxalase [Microterricola viridarii]
MPSMIFVNLAVNDLQRSRDFYSALGYTINENFSDENAICVVMSDAIYAMLLKPDFFKTFTKKELIDAQKSIQVLNALDEPSRDAVDAHLNKALAAGGTETRDAQDMGFMYSRAYADPDGHVWEIMWMDQAAAQDGPPDM